jgi:hypothetical protein
MTGDQWEFGRELSSQRSRFQLFSGNHSLLFLTTSLPLIYPPDPFRLAGPARPLEGYIDPQKKLFFGAFRQLVYFLYGRRG